MKLFLTIITALAALAYSQAQSTIANFSIDSGGARTIEDGIDILYTVGEVHVQEFDTGIISVSEGFINSVDFNALGAIHIKEKDIYIIVYPNPASDFINIKTNLFIQKVELYDFLGKQVLKRTNTNSINFNRLPKGVYLLYMYSINKKYHKKIVIK